MMQIDPNQIGAVYRRVSTDKQDAERQKEAVERWLASNDLTVNDDRVYEDIGWSRHEAVRRPEFNRMLREVDHGRIHWIVVDRQDRFECGDKFEFIATLHRLRKAGCKLYTADDVELTDNNIARFMMTGLESEKSESELREKSVRVLEEMRRRAQAGQWLGGRVPFGFDVVAFRLTPLGQLIEQWRVRMVGPDQRIKIEASGALKEYVGKGNFPATESDEILQLRPSTETSVITAAKAVFDKFASQAINYNALARQLNDNGLPHPPYSDRWAYHHVREMLRNPTYIGFPAWNKHNGGGYTEWRNGTRLTRTPGKRKDHEKADWVMPNNPLFEPVIDRATWDRVQQKLDQECPVKRRAPKSAKLWMSGLVYCAKCGQPMSGKIETHSRRPVYICSSYLRFDGPRRDSPCQINVVAQETIERLLGEYLKDTEIDLGRLSAAQDRPSFSEEFFRAADRFIEAHATMRERLKLPDPCGLTIDELTKRWGTVFVSEEAELQEQLGVLQRKHDALTAGIVNIPPTAKLALAKTQGRLSELEAQIVQTEALLADAEKVFDDAIATVMRLMKDWQKARDALKGETSARRKAEAIRSVISRIDLTFKPTGRRRPSSELTQVHVVPVSQSHRSDSLPLGTRSETTVQNSSRGRGCPSP